MAEGLLRYLSRNRIYVASAGVRAGEVDGFVLEVMEELGIDVSRHRPHTLEDLNDTSFDLIITLSPEAHHAALELTRTMAVDVVYWPTIDPTVADGARAQRLDGYRACRDGLFKRIKQRFPPPGAPVV